MVSQHFSCTYSARNLASIWQFSGMASVGGRGHSTLTVGSSEQIICSPCGFPDVVQLASKVHKTGHSVLVGFGVCPQVSPASLERL